MKALRQSSPSYAVKGLALLLCVLLASSGCSRLSVVQIRPPYPEKVHPGDGVKITTEDGTRYSGRVVYVDRAAVVIRTPRQTITKNPVISARYGTTIPWEKVRSIRVAGTLDSRGKLISNEEIRINRRTNLYRKLPINIGLLGLAASFLIAAHVQDNISPTSADAPLGRHSRGRMAFWTIWVGGTLGSVFLGHQVGAHLDRRRAIDRIERDRKALIESKIDSMLLRQEEER